MSLTLKAYAKINLTLEVLARRNDGYHEISSILQTISLADMLYFELSNELELQCSDAVLNTGDNLVLRAAGLLRKVTGYEKGARINLVKEIPVAAGLGSGSTDAAATLIGLNHLWGTNLPQERLTELAAGLGSDVPFFLYGGTAVASGRGENVISMPPIHKLNLVLLRPPIKSISGKTAQLYSQIKPVHFTQGKYTEKLTDHIRSGAHIENAMLYNVFEQVAFGFFPGLKEFKSRFIGAGAKTVHIAGSGPTLFTLLPGEDEGKDLISNLEADGLEAYLVQTVDESPLMSVGDLQ